MALQGIADIVLTQALFLSCFFHWQSRCEAILRTQPNSRITKELHLATIEAQEERHRKEVKKAAIGGVAAAAAVGVVAGVASMMLSKK